MQFVVSGHHLDVVSFLFILSRSCRGGFVCLSFTVIHFSAYPGIIKNPAYVSVSRVREIPVSFRTCLLQRYPNCLRAFARSTPRIARGLTHNPRGTALVVSLSRPALSASSWLICLCKFSFERVRRVAQQIGYSLLILLGVRLFFIRIFGWIDSHRGSRSS
jgi:hypothetical protein